MEKQLKLQPEFPQKIKPEPPQPPYLDVEEKRGYFNLMALTERMLFTLEQSCLSYKIQCIKGNNDVKNDPLYPNKETITAVNNEHITYCEIFLNEITEYKRKKNKEQ